MAGVSCTSKNELQADEGLDAMMAAIEEKLELAKAGLERRNWDQNRYICRVPPDLIRDDSYYDANCRPQVISVGPYHYGEPRLEAMQFYKYRMLHLVLEISKTYMSTMVNVVKNLEREAHACYEDLPRTKRFPSAVFVEMLLLDGCFIIGHAYKCAKDKDLAFYKAYNNYAIWKDMLLLENQIPLFVLTQLHGVIQANYWPYEEQLVDLLFRRLAAGWVIGRHPTSYEGEMPQLSSSLIQNIGGNVQSCIEILWHNLMYDSTTKEYTEKMEQTRRIDVLEPLVDLKQHAIPSATALTEAGVVLKHKTTTPFWDVVFNAGVLEIPQIFIYEASELVFLNLMAFELCHVDEKKYKVTPYILFMDSLVNSATDVAQLRAHGIIVYKAGSDEEVAALFNRLGKRADICLNNPLLNQPTSNVLSKPVLEEKSMTDNLYADIGTPR
ncbi:hypothetical protein Cgig2_003424 [Carnegiea gigantea]|uniref:Uncharacterized protein n=1 Tax=Carnegiea gigantea TaxID=171969 RepID=A0A9Q1K8C4_9CARY|nr:hypothetical protein Cgig2_003424 [Carnegiea gigantea]